MALELLHHHHHHDHNNKIHNINEDVLLEILVRLPPISVLRFKLVSKTWYALISHSKFLVRHSLHYHRYIQQTRRLDHLSNGLCFGPFLVGDDQVSRLYFPFDHQRDYLIFPPPPHPFPNHDQIQNPPPILRILNEDDHPLSFFPINDDHPMANFSFFTMSSFCNGLVIFRGHDSSTTINPRRKRFYDSTYFLCNPILKHYIELPRINPLLLGENDHILGPPSYVYEPAIVFDPTISLSCKIIRFLERDDSLQMFVYSQSPPPTCSSAEITTRTTSSSSSSSSWRLITSFPWEDSLVSSNGVLLNGVLYHLCGSDKVIICFHVVKEIVWFLQGPPLPMGIIWPCSTRYFGQCGGHLQIVAQNRDLDFSFNFPCSFDVWEMEHQQQQHDHSQEIVHSTEWTLKHRVKNIQPPPCYQCILNEEKYMDIHLMFLYKKGRKGDQDEEEEEEEALLMKMSPMDKESDMMIIFEFNLTSNTFGELLNLPFDYFADNYIDVFQYTMTLFPLSSSSSSS